jgi:hypothetical protein
MGDSPWVFPKLPETSPASGWRVAFFLLKENQKEISTKGGASSSV